MRNQYMFFCEQSFQGLDLSDFIKTDILIPRTNVHVYTFECSEVASCNDDRSKAQKLDELTSRLCGIYPDGFQIICSESSQYFCAQLYPLIVKFETKLRHALYVSRALYESSNVDKSAFLYDVGKSKKVIEDIDFGEIYEALFTDNNLKSALMKEYSSNLTKADLIKIINSLDENTMWNRLVGSDYGYICTHFLEIKQYRNDVMHNHLINFSQYSTACNVLQSAIGELDRAISDKLIVNQSDYSNKVNIVDSLAGLFEAMGTFASYVGKVATSEQTEKLIRFATLIGEKIAEAQHGDPYNQTTQDESADD